MHPPLSTKGSALKEHILRIPFTYDILEDETKPADLDDEKINDLYYPALEGSARVIPELKKLIARHPGYPTLKNYLMIAHQIRGEARQADAVLRQIVNEHPDYLFGKLAVAGRALEQDNPDKVPGMLGAAFDLQALYPERAVFHVSEVKQFYFTVANYLAHVGRPDEAWGAHAALSVILTDGDPVLPAIERVIMINNMKRMMELQTKEQREQIKVTPPPLPKKITATQRPVFQHAIIHELYDQVDFSLPSQLIEEILALPRESLIADLIRVIDDAIERTPYFMRETTTESADFALHAIHFLAELAAVEALDAVLRLLSQHDDLLEFWLGDFVYSEQFARLCEGNFDRVFTWLKAPGVPSFGKTLILSALDYLAQRDAGIREDVIARHRDLLEFFLTCPREANILDSVVISSLVGDAMSLRAIELLPLIEQAWEKRLILESHVGDLNCIREEMHAAPKSPPSAKPLSLVEQYRKYASQPNPPALLNGDLASLMREFSEADPGAVAQGLPVTKTGRNDPCPCGSGKKYKKCCL